MKDNNRKAMFAKKGKNNFTVKDYEKGEAENDHTGIALKVVEKYGSPSEINEMRGIYNRHNSGNGISQEDYTRRYQLSKPYVRKLYGEMRNYR